MSWSIYVIVIFFAAFIVVLILNPSLSCFGKKLRSPFYPLLRRKKKKLKTEDYGFSLVNEEDKQKVDSVKQRITTKGQDFSRVKNVKKEISSKKKKLKTQDYGFSLEDEEDK